jgi:3-hydroxyacyl-[acyl-carrier-protein] dehydratase
MKAEVRCLIPANHPCLPGHFPGVPLVPAVVILDEVVAALEEWQQQSQLSGIPGIKFLAPLKPEEPFTISLSATSQHTGEVSFCCRTEKRVIVQGRLSVVWGAM